MKQLFTFLALFVFAFPSKGQVAPVDIQLMEYLNDVDYDVAFSRVRGEGWAVLQTDDSQAMFYYYPPPAKNALRNNYMFCIDRLYVTPTKERTKIIRGISFTTTDAVATLALVEEAERMGYQKADSYLSDELQKTTYKRGDRVLTLKIGRGLEPTLYMLIAWYDNPYLKY